MKISRFLEITVLFAGSWWLVACSEEPSCNRRTRVSKTPVPAASAPAALETGNAVDTGLPFSWVVPPGWEAGKSSSMRLASYNVPLSNGEVGDFSLTQLGGGAGGVLANINRWRGQIGLDAASAEQVSGFAHSHSTRQGHQFLHITLINPENPDNAILAAIFEQPGYLVFAKLTASRSGAEEAQEAFEAFCNSLTFKDA